VFVDEHGTRCAMAYLIERSGEPTLVSRIARTRNLARIRDLAGDPELVAWLDRNGITIAEAARIQPAYDGEPPSGSDQGSSALAGGAIGAVVGLTGVALNLSLGQSQNSRNARGLTGVLFGLVGAGVGAAILASEEDPARVLGAFDVGLGVVSLGLGLRQLNARPAPALAAAPALWRDRSGATRAALVARF